MPHEFFQIQSGQSGPASGADHTKVNFGTGNAFIEIPVVVVTEWCNPPRSPRPILNLVIKEISKEGFIVGHDVVLGDQPNRPTFNWVAVYSRDRK